MSMEIAQSFELRTGNSRDLVFYVKKPDGTVMPLVTGFSAEWRFFRPNAQSPFMTKNSKVTSAVSITDPAMGEVTVKLVKTDTVDLPDGLYYHELVIIDALDNEISVSSGNGFLYRKKQS